MLRGPPAEMKTHDVVRNEGMTLFKSVEQQLFTSAAPSYVNFLYQKEQAAQAAKNADKPKKTGGKKKGKKKGKKGSKKKKASDRIRHLFEDALNLEQRRKRLRCVCVVALAASSFAL